MSRRLVRVAVSMSLGVLASVPVALLSGTAAQAGAPAAAAVIGSAPEHAAASCWEIKQVRSSAPSGVYWLYTPKLTQPMQFYCDQTTDGGGWVLVGKGRETWNQNHAGQNGIAADGNTSEAMRTPNPASTLDQTFQLDVPTINGLLNGADVKSLSVNNSGDGVRLRRAQNSSGSSWQESRVRFKNLTGWSWSILGGEHALSGSNIGGLSFSNQNAQSFGTSQIYNRVMTSGGESRNWRYGFRYGTFVSGQNNTTSYLWAGPNGGGAAPFTQVYVRPKVQSSVFTNVAASGTPAIELPKGLDNQADVMPWGVAGIKGASSAEYMKEVQAFAESGNVMYVGGNFRYVQKDGAGTGRVEQSYLAAFDKTTGQWIDTFRPTLNEQVHSLAVLPDGTLVAGGAFSQANGKAATALVGLDPTTGATKPNWNVTVESRVTGSALRIMTLQVQGGDLYLGGVLTHLAGGTAPNTFRYAKNAARLSVSDLTPSSGWNPDLNGSVFDISPSSNTGKVYASGFFTTSKGVSSDKAAVLSTGPDAGLLSIGWRPSWSNAKSYQMTIVEGENNRFYSGGAEHALMGFDQTSYARTSGAISKVNGGDMQSSDRTDDGLIFVGTHSNEFIYDNAFTWEDLSPGWTTADSIKWMGTWDSATGKYSPEFSPVFNMRAGSGIWAIDVDSTGKVWAGGDVASVGTAVGTRWSGGFARFSRKDTTAPAAPGNVKLLGSTASTVTLGWNAATGTPVRYQVLRDDRVVGYTSGTSLTVPKGAKSRYFIRAVDATGNVGASSVAFDADNIPDNQAPSAAFAQSVDRLTVSVDGSTSIDPEGAHLTYSWTFGDGESATGVTASHTYARGGSYTVKLTVTDEDGATASTERTVDVTQPVTGTFPVIQPGSSWKWRYEAAAPAAEWKSDAAVSSGWSAGAGSLGWGTTPLGTRIDEAFATTSARPLTAYFTRTVEIDKAADVTKFILDSYADDGAVFYVNGVEVARQNMPSGAVGHTSYASSSRQTAVAKAQGVKVEVPRDLLRNGTNIIAVETHVNYRATPNMSFDLSAELTIE